MYQLNKNIGKKKWEKFACGKKRIGKTARTVGRKAVTRFVCGEGLIFFKKIPRFKTTNIYELNDWVVETFRFFELKGMMKGIMDDFEKWRKTFLKRINNWLLPLLEKGHCLKDILMNKLSTKKTLKGADPKPLKGAGIKPSGSHEAFQGFISGTEWVSDVHLKEIEKLLKKKMADTFSDLKWYALEQGNRIYSWLGLFADRFAANLRPKKS